jgi:hypothetical protein
MNIWELTPETNNPMKTISVSNWVITNCVSHICGEERTHVKYKKQKQTNSTKQTEIK